MSALIDQSNLDEIWTSAMHNNAKSTYVASELLGGHLTVNVPQHGVLSYAEGNGWKLGEA